jgi:hypothetical protein
MPSALSHFYEVSMRLKMNPGHEHEVYGRLVRAGTEFEVPENEARLWKTSGRASDAPPRTKSLDAEPPASDAQPPEPPVKRGPGRPRKYPTEGAPTYNRRDMRAEDE